MTGDTAARRAQLAAAEDRALALFDRIEELGFIVPGRTEREVERDIEALAGREFDVTRHWHRRIVHCGANGIAVAGAKTPILTIAEDDLVFVDLGPVFAEWEADVGRSYVVGDDPDKHRLVADLADGFDAMKAVYDTDDNITGDALYAFAVEWSEERGWRFGGVIAGHIVGEFPHTWLPGEKDFYRINPANTGRLRDPDPTGGHRFWIGEVHLVSPDGRFGGFYERLLDR